MNIQEHLAVFDGWLTGRIEEASTAGKDLAFRDLAPEIRLGINAWEYSLLEPGQRSPLGEGWSVYRLQGVWPEFARIDAELRAPERRTLLGVIADAIFGPDGKKR